MSTNGSASGCQFTVEDIETITGSGLVEQLPLIWRVLQHVYGGREPIESNINCHTCHEALIERGLGRGIRTPNNDLAQEFSQYFVLFGEALSQAKSGGKAEMTACFKLWFASCPRFWRSEFESMATITMLLLAISPSNEKDDDNETE